MNRRGFLTGVAGLLAAPAIVRVSSLMPVSVPKIWTWEQGPLQVYSHLDDESLIWAVNLLQEQAWLKAELFGVRAEL